MGFFCVLVDSSFRFQPRPGSLISFLQIVTDLAPSSEPPQFFLPLPLTPPLLLSGARYPHLMVPRYLPFVPLNSPSKPMPPLISFCFAFTTVGRHFPLDQFPPFCPVLFTMTDVILPPPPLHAFFRPMSLCK